MSKLSPELFRYGYQQDKGDYMTWKFTSVFTFCFCFMFFSFLAVHHAHMKSPSQNREIASWTQPAKPWYDASYKL